VAIANVDDSVPTVGSAEHQPGLLVYGLCTLIGLALISVAYYFSYQYILPSCAKANSCAPGEGLFKPSSDYSILAGVLIATLAVERLMEPISRFLGPDTDRAKADRDVALANAKKDAGTEKAEDKANALARAQAQVDRARQLTALLAWAAATSVAMVFASMLHILLLYAITAPGSSAPPTWADLLVTGLVIGAGTKPVHDLVSQLAQAKEKAEDPPQTQIN
jgi:hypothetical protein